MRKIRRALCSAFLLLGVFQGILHAQDTSLPASEIQARNRLLKAPIKVSGRILDANGQPLVGAIVTLNGRTNVAGTNGNFVLRTGRTNGLLRVSAPGFRDELLAVDLALPMKTRRLAIDNIPMTATGAVRMI